MFIRIDWELYEKVCGTTKTDYEAIGEFLPCDNVISLIEDLLHEIELKNEQLDDVIADMENNYMPIPPEKEYGEDKL